jgi:hypothetical protein
MIEPAAQTLDEKRGRFRPGAWRRSSYGSLARICIPLLIGAGGTYIDMAARTRWHRFEVLALAFVFAGYLAVVLRGRLRDVLAVVASLLLCLAAIEIYCVDTFLPTIDINTPGYTAAYPIVGWGPGHPGVFHHTKIDTKTRRVIWDVDYTIDANRHRQVLSDEDGPGVVFFGGSDTFGTGVADADTLPQQFADATGRRLHVVNLGYPGYGPQQLLRGLETGLFDDVLKNSRLLVIETTPWQAGRTACVNEYMARAPRYELVDGQPTFRGTCSEGWPLLLRALSEVSSLPHFFVLRALQNPKPATIDLYLAIVVRTAAIARDTYGVPTVILYQPGDPYLRPTGSNDQQLMQRFRDGGVAVVDGALNPADFPGQDLEIPGEGHPTGVTNHAWATLLRDFFDTSVEHTR